MSPSQAPRRPARCHVRGGDRRRRTAASDLTRSRTACRRRARATLGAAGSVRTASLSPGRSIAPMDEPLPAWSLPAGAEREIALPAEWPERVTPEWAFGDADGAGVRVCLLDSGITAGHPLVEVER